MERKALGYYNYTVILTYVGMLIGFLGITSAMEGKIHMALICLMISGVCDMFDGAVASTKQRSVDEKCFGIQIDSLSDLICFGVLPAIIVLRRFGSSEVACGVAGIYVLCALIRLSYFNVDEQNRQKTSTESRQFYFGLPVTTIALILPMYAGIENLISVKYRRMGLIVLLVTGILFLIPFKLKKPQVVGKVAMGIFGFMELAFLVIGIGDI